MNMKADVVVGMVLLSTFILLLPFAKPMAVPIDITFVPEKVVFDFTRSISLSGEFSSANLQIVIPQNTSSQNVFVKQILGAKHIATESFATIWKWKINRETRIQIEYSGEIYGKIWKQESSATISDIPKEYKSKYIHNEYVNIDNSKKYVIFVDNNEIKNLAEKITAPYSNILDKLKAIHTYIARNFKYEISNNENVKSALEVLHSGGGDCDELSFLYASLARSVGIPTWVVYGLLYDGNTWGYHAWVRTYIPDIGKVDCDITSDIGQIKFTGFLTKTPYHLEIWEDDGNSEHLSEMYKYVEYTGYITISDNYTPKIIKQSPKNIAISNPYIISREYLLAIIGIIFLAMFFFARRANVFMIDVCK